jgi:drug/metabolite transporter (DMT)-like permease
VSDRRRASLEQWLYFGERSRLRTVTWALVVVVGLAGVVLTGLLIAASSQPTLYAPGAVLIGVVVGVALFIKRKER